MSLRVNNVLRTSTTLRKYHINASLNLTNTSTLPDLSSPNWSSEALIPRPNPSTKRITTFHHSNDPSPLSKPFLNSRSLANAANSVIALSAEFRGGVATGTAFEVAPGGISLASHSNSDRGLNVVFLTHNHFPAQPVSANGFPAVLKSGEIFRLNTRKIHDLSYNEARARIPLDFVLNKWTKERHDYLVLLKTLQQARMEGVWVPGQGGYQYKWGDKVFSATKAVPWDLRLLLDIGVLNISSEFTATSAIGRTRLFSTYGVDGRLFPSRRVREVNVDTPLAAIGFPSVPSPLNRYMKSREELSSYYSGSGGQLRACIGKLKFVGTGTLFNEPYIETLLVQNILQTGSSGGPLISPDDDNTFLGLASGTEFHLGREVVGARYLTVDNPVVIATYLHFLLPRYEFDKVPLEILYYLELHKRFCEWYVEVAWQRLPQQMKTPGLKRHWGRFADLERPRNKVVEVRDSWDDWRGVQQVHIMRLGDVLREIVLMGGDFVRGHWGQVGESLRTFGKRARIINKKW